MALRPVFVWISDHRIGIPSACSPTQDTLLVRPQESLSNGDESDIRWHLWLSWNALLSSRKVHNFITFTVFFSKQALPISLKFNILEKLSHLGLQCASNCLISLPWMWRLRKCTYMVQFRSMRPVLFPGFKCVCLLITLRWWIQDEKDKLLKIIRKQIRRIHFLHEWQSGAKLHKISVGLQHKAIRTLHNSGQICISTNRVYVRKDIVDEFTEKLKKHIEETYTPNVGDPTKGAVICLMEINWKQVLGPQADKIQHNHVMKSIKEGKKSGAKVVTGGGRHRDNGYFIQPTIFRDVRTKYTKSNN